MLISTLHFAFFTLHLEFLKLYALCAMRFGFYYFRLATCDSRYLLPYDLRSLMPYALGSNLTHATRTSLLLRILYFHGGPQNLRNFLCQGLTPLYSHPLPKGECGLRSRCNSKCMPHNVSFLQKATLTNAADPEQISAGIPSYGTDE